MNDVLRECLDEYAVAFVDDILIYSENVEDHQRQVREVLRRLQKAGLQVALSKSEFSVKETRFLGFIVSTDGIAVDPEKIRVVQSWTIPTTVKGIQSFLGFCNFYRRFIQGYSAISKPLHRLSRQDIPFEWSENCERAFQTLKNKLVSAPILRHYDPVRQTRVETDASDGVMGAVLSQYYEQEDFWHPVAFYSKTMQPAELNYEVRDKELLAIVRALQEWRPELEGLSQKDRFEILTDHQSLEYFMTTRQMNQRQARWNEFLSQFRFVIKYRPGKKNIIADVLSRKESPCVDNGRQFVMLSKDCLEEGVYPTHLAPIHSEETETIGVVERIKEANRQSSELDEFRQIVRDGGSSRWTLLDGPLYEGRLEVPNEGDLRARLLDEIHRQPLTAHPGIEKLKKLVSTRYHWYGWATDVKRYVDNCLICKRTKTWRDRTPDYYGLYQFLKDPGSISRWISDHFRRIVMAMMLSLLSLTD
ncbi:hypothetical protein PDIDSM_7929 [Penicillium digitatum]|nr:hypothetical protein PDIDSM_7929 [Penicillium digitatum]